jgi:branched-chain amino acid transport system ATP-binding protein
MLSVNGLSKSFGGLEVVRDLSVEVAAGECLGIMGPNGAGKSTFFDLVSVSTGAQI